MANQQLTMLPLTVVIESKGTRRAIYPYWSQDQETKQEKAIDAEETSDMGILSAGCLESTSPLSQFFDRLSHFNGEVMLLGIEDVSEQNERIAAELGEVAKSYEFLRIATLIEQFQNELIRRKNDFHHDISNAVQITHELLLIGQIEAM